jgi:predicted dehydrogenase
MSADDDPSVDDPLSPMPSTDPHIATQHDDRAAAGQARDRCYQRARASGASAVEVARLADRASATGAFAAVPFVWRHSPFAEAVRDAPNDPLLHLSVKSNAGPSERYREANSVWMRDRPTAGEGPTIVYGVNYFDLFAYLAGNAPVEVTSSAMSNARSDLAIEDQSFVTLSAGACIWSVETGYTLYSETGVADSHISATTPTRYIRHVADGDALSLEVQSHGQTDVIEVTGGLAGLPGSITQ